MSEALRYPAQVFFSEEDEGYVAVAPDLPGASAFGETADEAVRELQDAIKAWIGAAKQAGNPIPSPSPREVEELPSGRVLARLPKTLHAQLIERATRDNTSLNTCLVMLLTKALSENAHVPENAHVKEDPVHRGMWRLLDVPTRVTRTTRRVVFAGGGKYHVATDNSPPFLGEKTEGVVRGGYVLNVYDLPAGKPVIYLDDENA